MIHVCTKDDRSREAEAAYQLRDLIRKVWPALAEPGEDMWIFVNANCPTSRRDLWTADIDILILAAFDRPMSHPRNHSIQFKSLRLAVEVKDHSHDECLYRGGQIRVEYRDRSSSKSATRQNQDQCFALKGYLNEKYNLEIGFVSHALWMRNAEIGLISDEYGKAPNPTSDFVLGKGARWADFLDLVCEREERYARERGTANICGYELVGVTRKAIEVFEREHRLTEQKKAAQPPTPEKHRHPDRDLVALFSPTPRSRVLKCAKAPFLFAGMLLRGANKTADAVFASFRKLFNFTLYLIQTALRFAGAVLILVLAALALLTASDQMGALKDVLPHSPLASVRDAVSEMLPEGQAETAQGTPPPVLDGSSDAPASKSVSNAETLSVSKDQLRTFFDADFSSRRQSTAAQCRRRALSALYEAVEERYQKGYTGEVHRETVCPRYKVISSWQPPFTVDLLERDQQQRDQFGNGEIVYNKTYQAR